MALSPTPGYVSVSQVVQTRFYGNERVLAAVVGTGFSTAKGGMVRSILFPRKLSVRFYVDAMKFVLLLSILGLVNSLSLSLPNLNLSLCMQLAVDSSTLWPSTFISSFRFTNVFFLPVFPVHLPCLSPSLGEGHNSASL